MQSIAVYGRLLTRALASTISDELRSLSLKAVQTSARAKQFSLVTASAGISKSQPPQSVASKWGYGDDAFFVAKHKLSDVIGVADGVGGWRSYGIDPSKFPQSLMSICQRLVKNGHFKPQEPKEILCSGYREILENKMSLLGSCTACLVALDKEDHTLYSANLGDSGFMVIRGRRVVHRSQEQQHYFNTPFQLSIAPSTLQGVVLSDSPDSANTMAFTVEEGDLIVVGTDGLFDNLSDELILKSLTSIKTYETASLQEMAHALCQFANTLAFDEEYMSPFALHAAQNGLDVKGGKPDDITVVLARVTADGLETST